MNIFPMYLFALVYFFLFALATCALSAAGRAQDKLDGLISSPMPARLLLRQRARAHRTAGWSFLTMLAVSAALVGVSGVPF